MSWYEKSIERIKQARIPHRNYLRAIDDMVASISVASPGEIICLIGPSRVGKSRLSEEIGALITGGAGLYSDAMPVVSVVATNCSTNGAFSTKSFTLRMLEAVSHPFYSPRHSKDVFDYDYDRRIAKISEGVLRPALERAMTYRKVKYLVIDEAHHILYSRGGIKSATAFYDSLKCLAQVTGCVIVLVGAYPLLYALQHSVHMLGRKHQLHFSRYLETDTDRRSFKEIVATYSEMVPLADGLKSLLSIEDMLYSESFGCIGLLELWLCNAIADAMARKAPLLELENFSRTRRSKLESEQIAGEILEGEAFLASRFGDGDSYGSSDSRAPGPGAITTTKQPTSRKPFQAKQRRYPLGGRG